MYLRLRSKTTGHQWDASEIATRYPLRAASRSPVPSRPVWPSQRRLGTLTQNPANLLRRCRERPSAAFDPGRRLLKVLVVPIIEAPSIDELTALEVFELQCYLSADGWNPSTDEQVSVDDRLCDRQTYERRGRFSDSLEITYVYQGQDMDAEDNKAFSMLRAGETGFLVPRWGIDHELPIEVGDLVDVYPAEYGVQRKQPPEANGRLRITQKVFITGPTQRDVEVVAAS